LGVTPGWFLPSKLFWFVLGIVVCLQLRLFTAWINKYKWAFLTGALLFLAAGIYEWEWLLTNSGKEWIPYYDTVIDSFYAGTFILSYLAFEQIRIPRSKNIRELGVNSYGIYLAHSPILEYTSRIIYNLVPGALGYQVVFQPILIAMGLGVPFLFMSIMSYPLLNRYYKYVFG
jgi:peptidoglycan/LPS O-acetylase OafA/YrhL